MSGGEVKSGKLNKGKKRNWMSEFQRLRSVLFPIAANQSPEEETEAGSCSKCFLSAVIQVLRCTHRAQTPFEELDFCTDLLVCFACSFTYLFYEDVTIQNQFSQSRELSHAVIGGTQAFSCLSIASFKV